MHRNLHQDKTARLLAGMSRPSAAVFLPVDLAERITRPRRRALVSAYSLRWVLTNGLVSTPARLFLAKHASRRPRAAVLPSSGTRSVAPSPLT